MIDEVVLIERGAVLELRLNRPAKKNAITSAMYRALFDGLSEAARRSDIGAVLIAADGDTFSAGNDLADFLRSDGGEAAFDFIRTIAAFEKPIVVAAQGMAVGIGTTLLLHCDLVFASPDTRFVLPFVSLGLVPEAGSSLMLPARIGAAKAAAMLLLGEPMDAAAAEVAGLITAIVPADQLLEHARAKADALTRQPPQALQEARRLMKGDPAAITDRIEEEAHSFRAALLSAEAKEAFTAFLEKRPPVFIRTAAKHGR